MNSVLKPDPTVLAEAVASQTWSRLVLTKLLHTREFVIICSIIATCWALAFANATLGGELVREGGIQPRKLFLPYFAILWAPLLHDNFGLLFSNSLAFFVLGGFVIKRGIHVFAAVVGAIAVGSGTMVWALGSATTTHVGLSGILFGLCSYLIVIGILLEEARLNAFVAVVVMVMYAGVFMHAFPTSSQVSWEAHLFGLMVGGICAVLEYKWQTKAQANNESASSSEKAKLIEDA
eukprot:TRINITY_DN1505_c0_g1_i1.p1 TRINITY_DN1505_c0_g1~~TRINITY_DN1505_c0_g1_i1.p1  ORF type:complete len:235 (+),score=108.61 TRINITY_DN1505_c0_g1_i1:61-765(+)